MTRELPVFDPNPAHAHASAAEISIAMGGGQGLVEAPAATGTRPLRRHPDWIKSRMPSGDNYHDLKGLLRGLNLNTVCEEARLPQRGRVLGPAHRDRDDPGRRLHPGLRVLRHQDRAGRPGSTTTSRAASRRRSARCAWITSW